MENKDVIATIELLLEEIDGVISALNDQGAQLFSEGNYEEAYKHLSEAIRLRPDLAGPRQAMQMLIEMRSRKKR